MLRALNDLDHHRFGRDIQIADEHFSELPHERPLLIERSSLQDKHMQFRHDTRSPRDGGNTAPSVSALL
jgi:hypothetical protein